MFFDRLTLVLHLPRNLNVRVQITYMSFRDMFSRFVLSIRVELAQVTSARLEAS